MVNNVIITALVLTYLMQLGNAQNVLLNGSFENYSVCPDLAPSDVSVCSGWSNPNIASPDYFNTCAPVMTGYSTPWNVAGFQGAFEGNGYAGVFTFDMQNLQVRDYITGSLASPLISGKKYYVSFQTSHSDNFRYAIKTLGAYFTPTAPFQNDGYYWQVTPQIVNKGVVLTDTSIWYQVADTFTAVGGEQYITIGNFQPDSLSDTTLIYPGWYYNASYYFIDDVKVIPYDSVIGLKDNKFANFEIEVYPNPAKGNVTINLKNIKGKSQLEIFGVEGKLLKHYQLTENIKQQNLNLDELEPGVYFYRVMQERLILKTDKIIIYR